MKRKISKFRAARVFRSAVFEENSCHTRVDVRADSDDQTEQRVVRGGVDVLTPLTQAIDDQRRRKLREEFARGAWGVPSASGRYVLDEGVSVKAQTVDDDSVITRNLGRGAGFSYTSALVGN